MKSKMDNDERLFEAISSCLDSSGELDLEELRATRRMLGHDVEKSEKEFLGQLAQLRKNRSRTHGVESMVGEPIRGLLDHARANGVDAMALADKSGLSVSLVTKLDRRLIAFASIPGKIIERTAVALQLSVESLIGYLRQPPALATGARYKAKETPSVPAVQDFFEAVASDRSISEERRKELLQFKKSE